MPDIDESIRLDEFTDSKKIGTIENVCKSNFVFAIETQNAHCGIFQESVQFI